MEIENRSDFFENDFESFDIRSFLEKYLRHWKWFVFSVLFFIVLAFIKIRYEVPLYSIKASILIKEQQKGNSTNELAYFNDLGLLGNNVNSLENEMQIFKSRKLMRKVIKELKLNIQYFIEDSPNDQEQYPNFPVVLDIKTDSVIGNLDVDKISASFDIEVISKDKFRYIAFPGESGGVKKFNEEFIVNLRNKVSNYRLKISLNSNDNYKYDLVGKTLKIKITPLESVVSKYTSLLQIYPVNENNSSVLILSINESNKEKGVTVINNLIQQYNADGIYDKNEISQTSIDFLNLRLGLISEEIVAIESTAEQFKTKNRMLDVNTDGEIFMQTSSQNESEMVSVNIQLQMINFMLNELSESEKGALLPGNIGLSDPTIVGMTNEYNELVLQRNRVLKSSSEINPIVVGIDSQLNVLKNNLNSGLLNLKSSLEIQIEGLNKQSGKINSRIASVPKNEREFKDIVRQQETKNALYLFLLQKREESEISKSLNLENSKIIDRAYASGGPVSPKKTMIYLASIVLGLFLPFGLIYVKDILDSKIHDENDVKKLKLPFLGTIPISPDTSKSGFVMENDNSETAEAFRYIRTNINFMLDNKKSSKIVFLTSTLSHEGKSFVSINLARSLAISGKKTLLLGLDLRAPKISNYLETDFKLGVSNYIIDNNLNVSDIIDVHTDFENLDIVYSGVIPPNPVELLMSKRVQEIFDYCSEIYDYIIVDTAPVGLVTDTIQIGNKADLTIYIMKADYLDKRMLHIPKQLQEERKLKNMAVLINGAKTGKGTYGYGYGYGKKRNSWFQ